MVDEIENSSQIVDYYTNKNIFVTGASGFIGKVLLEKLFRTCPNLNKIYILLRSKKGLKPYERIKKEFTDCKLFEHVDKNLIFEKLIPVDGDLLADRFSLTDESLQELKSNVNIVFHIAASVRFDDPLRDAIRYNVLGTKTALSLAHEMTNLESFVHVSTAYAYCHLEQSEERFYPIKITPSKLIEICDQTDDEQLKKGSENFLEGRPNNYTFTKAVTEHYLNENRGQLPVAIARPSIVTASVNEPFAGWIDSFNGPAGASLLGALGISRTIYCKPNSVCDFIPIDIVTNALIAIAWKTASEFRTRQLEHNNNTCTSSEANEKDDSNSITNSLPIYNITSGDVNPITWEKFFKYEREIAMTMPSKNMVRIPMNSPKGDRVNWYSHVATKIISETLFAYLFDLILLVIGRKTFMIRLVRKMHNAFDSLGYFVNRQWSFPCDNLLSLYDSLSEKDKSLFDFDVRKVDWRTYTYDFYIGMRRHLMKEKDKDVPQALQHMRRIKFIFAMLKVASVILLIFAFQRVFPVQSNHLMSMTSLKKFS